MNILLYTNDIDLAIVPSSGDLPLTTSQATPVALDHVVRAPELVALFISVESARDLLLKTSGRIGRIGRAM